MKAQTEQTPQSPRELNPAIPEAVEEAIMRAVRKDPNERFQTAGDFREMLLMASGLGNDGVMHGATGSFRRSSASKPPVSSPGVVSGEVAQAALRSTRLASTEVAPSAPSKPVMAPTRHSDRSSGSSRDRERSDKSHQARERPCPRRQR